MPSTRREFLKATLGASALLSLSPRPSQAFGDACAGTTVGRREGRSLVVLQLAGGNDGLNTVVPYADDQYHRNRPTLRLRQSELHRIDDQLGFHPQMKGFHRLLSEGHLTVVQGVGYPNPDRSHSRSMRIWQAASLSPDDAETGWVGRAADRLTQAEPGAVGALLVAKVRPALALTGRRAIVSQIRQPADLLPRAMAGPEAAEHRRELLPAGQAEPEEAQEQSLARLVRTTAIAATAINARIEAVLASRPARADRYPTFSLARSLRTVADLIRAELPVAIYYVEMGGQEPGGFDTHANQAGNHAALLQELSESVTAFVDDLGRDRLLDRMVLMTFSEFGRSLAENGRHGTDHGAASPLFLAGGELIEAGAAQDRSASRTPADTAVVRGSGSRSTIIGHAGGNKARLVGRPPNLVQMDGNAPRFQIDFRQVYAMLLDRWLGIDSVAVLGDRFEHVDVLPS